MPRLTPDRREIKSARVGKHGSSPGNSVLEEPGSVCLCTREAPLSLRSANHYCDMEKLIKHEETSLQREEFLCLRAVQRPAVFHQTRMSLSERVTKWKKKKKVKWGRGKDVWEE